MNKILYYILQWTWGLPMNLLGLIVVPLFAMRYKKRCHFEKYRKAIGLVIPWNFGGVNLGMFYIRGENCNTSTSHEYGHSIQNLYFGWAMPLVVSIPSAVRYWYRTLYFKYIYPKNRKALPPYDSIWFEKQATILGKQAKQNKWTWM